ncbi:site-specific integrase [Leeuwenhoekiella marinoflava]|uniref:Site-specific recombinase XerD n=2 Tax=Leeuwenhoekiella marinoflava TaxID=988 RepID=A0A4Q0PNW0_9FLAO|nr:site-specific integrase [Leeuwenhoekiella marinoflava]RXG31812.1 site-specific recombinase XerD [Leeuwenhoekiella marinoflava]SHF04212.1 Site-specific recombinase XerD [Leeuwenhoekiella marinoflava DSM 3653]
MATVNFLYRSTKDESTLNARLLYRLNSPDYPEGYKDFVLGSKTNIQVSKHYWSKLHNKRSKDIEIQNKQTEINSQTNELSNFILKAFDKEPEQELDKKWLQNVIKNYYSPQDEEQALPKDVVNYHEAFIDMKGSELTEGTKRKYRVTKNLLIRYEKEINSKVLIKNVNLSFKKRFEAYCLDKGYAPNTITRAFRTIKTLCRHAKFHGLETSYQLDSIKSSYHKVPNIYLNFEELEKLEKIDPEKLTESYENVRDWLIISCYTGQRVSDFMRFHKEQIRIENGKSYIEFTQKKTGKVMTVPLHPKVLETLEKRNGEFPKAISDQRYNDYVKEVCKIAEINQKVTGSKKLETEPGSKKYRKKTGIYEKWELVSSHIGRRSFATNFYGTIPTSYLIYATGHSTEAMFLNYIGKSNKDLAIEMTKFF